jgi:predicted enzyme related to lactoylglutathione lyase
MPDETTQDRADSNSVDGRLIRHGGLSYLEIPAIDPARSALFYEKMLGWHVNREDADHLKFSDRDGYLIGRWIRGRAIARDAGILPFIYVDQIPDAVACVASYGGEIVRSPYPEGDLLVCTLRDPAGNLIGLWQAR